MLLPAFWPFVVSAEFTSLMNETLILQAEHCQN
ncbi:hypothetical protein EMIT0232MI5_30355 [Pseudomonas sp. IT-232MI5]